MELGVQPRLRRRHRGLVSASCGRPGCPVLAPFPLGSEPRGCPGGMAGAGRTPQPRGQVKLLHRAGRAAGPLRAAAQPRALPGSPAARLHPSHRLRRRPRLPAVAPRPGGRFHARPPGPLALRPWRCPVPATRLQVAPGPPLTLHARRPLPAARVWDLHIPPSSAHPRRHLAQPRVPPAPRLWVRCSQSSLSPSPRPVPPSPGCGPAKLPALAARLAFRAQGRGRAPAGGARRGWGGGCASQSVACRDPPRETWLRGGGGRGGRGAGSQPPPRGRLSWWETFLSPPVAHGHRRFLGLASARAEWRAEFLIIKKLSYGRGDE